jgi:hypothetical protein
MILISRRIQTKLLLSVAYDLFCFSICSIDGWEVSLNNIMIPVGKGSSDMLYCVSLTLSNIGVSSHTPLSAERCLDDQFISGVRVE